MAICIRCETNERTGYKYCEECKKRVKVEQDVIYQKIRRFKQRKLCIECGKNYTNSKYCTSCSQIVRARKARERTAAWHKANPRKEVVKPRRKTIMDNDIEIDEKWLSRGEIQC